MKLWVIFVLTLASAAGGGAGFWQILAQHRTAGKLLDDPTLGVIDGGDAWGNGPEPGIYKVARNQRASTLAMWLIGIGVAAALAAAIVTLV